MKENSAHSFTEGSEPTKPNSMDRYSNKLGDMIKDENGGWVMFSDVSGTEQEIKEWMRKYARHADYPKCQIRTTGRCSCGLNNFITKPI